VGGANARSAVALEVLAQSPLTGRTSSTWFTPRDTASSYSVMIVGFRRPCSMPLIYCWLKPEISASRSCVRPFFSLIRLTFFPTNLRISMHRRQRITLYKFINYSMLNLATPQTVGE